MDVIWHDGVGMEVVVAKDSGGVPDAFNDHARNDRLAQIIHAAASFVQ
jgi:hypothetical protein